MSEPAHGPEHERRMHRAAVTSASRQPPEPAQEPEAAEPEDEDFSPAQRLEQQTLWVDWQVRQAMARGDFDNLPGAGKPIRGLGGTHDPDWWVKRLIEREQITGVGPPALALRKEDAELDTRLDREGAEQGVRQLVSDFNRRVVEARRQLHGGPPVVTSTRDVDDEVARWRARRAERLDRLRRQLRESPKPQPRRSRWSLRRRSR